MGKTLFLLMSLTSSLGLIVCDRILLDDAGDDVGVLPSGGSDLLEAVFRRRSARSQHGGAGDGRATRFSDDDERNGESVGRNSDVSAYEWSPWRRIVAKILSEGDERNERQDTSSSVLSRRKRFCCSIDMYCFICDR